MLSLVLWFASLVAVHVVFGAWFGLAWPEKTLLGAYFIGMPVAVLLARLRVDPRSSVGAVVKVVLLLHFDATLAGIGVLAWWIGFYNYTETSHSLVDFLQLDRWNGLGLLHGGVGPGTWGLVCTGVALACVAKTVADFSPTRRWFWEA